MIQFTKKYRYTPIKGIPIFDFELSTICETIENCHNSMNLIFG